MNGKMIELIRRNGILLAGAGVACAALFFGGPGDKDEAVSKQNEINWMEESEDKTKEKADSTDVEQESVVNKSFKVDVKGAVHKPGVYEFTDGDRVTDVIQKAGGLKEGADSKQVNMAQLVEDEMVVYIPKKGEEMDTSKQLVTEKPGTGESNSNGIININKASSEELQELPGIGPSKATAIIQKREELGSFKTIEDLKEVSGIGDKTFEKLKDSITVN